MILFIFFNNALKSIQINDMEIIKLDLRIKNFFEEMLKILKQEYKIICEVFPNSDAVMSQLIKKLFKKRVFIFFKNNNHCYFNRLIFLFILFLNMIIN